MDAAERRSAISRILSDADSPISAASLASKLGVSRQVIVGDVAILRASGESVFATPRGYIRRREEGGLLRTVACRHDMAGTEHELCIFVDNGVTVLDVVVEHPVYGQLTGELRISSRYDVKQFIERLTTEKAAPLSALTGGVHLHNLICPDEDTYKRCCRALDKAGFLFK